MLLDCCGAAPLHLYSRRLGSKQECAVKERSMVLITGPAVLAARRPTARCVATSSRQRCLLGVQPGAAANRHIVPAGAGQLPHSSERSCVAGGCSSVKQMHAAEEAAATTQAPSWHPHSLVAEHCWLARHAEGGRHAALATFKHNKHAHLDCREHVIHEAHPCIK